MKEFGSNNTMVPQFTFCLFNNKKDALELFQYTNGKHPTIRFTMEMEVNHKLPFLDVLLDNCNPAQSLVTSVFHKSTYTGLFTNFLSFSPFSYKLGLTRTLVDRTSRINNTWTRFHNNIKELTNILKKNQFPSHLVKSTVKQYLSKFFASPSHASTVTSPNITPMHYYKLPFVGPFSSITLRRIRCLTQRFCNNLDIKLIENLFSVNDTIPKTLRSPVVYKFSCAGCSACYVGETNRHLTTYVREHLTSDKNSHIFQHINRSETGKALCSEDCFSILDIVSTSFQLKIKEALHIGWEKPLLNKQVNHVNLSLSF